MPSCLFANSPAATAEDGTGPCCEVAQDTPRTASPNVPFRQRIPTYAHKPHPPQYTPHCTPCTPHPARAHHPALLPVRHVPPTHPPTRAGRAAAAPNCPAGWLPAVGTLYDSWPAPGTTECIDYSGCEWAGQFNNIDPGDAKPCNRGAKWLSGGLKPPNFACRFPQSLVKKWNVAATYMLDNALLGRKLQVAAQVRVCLLRLLCTAVPVGGCGARCGCHVGMAL